MQEQFLSFVKKWSKPALVALVAVAALAVAFKAGTVVGFRKAAFADSWGKNYEKNFLGHKPRMMPRFAEREQVDANGGYGTVLKIALPTVIMAGKEGDEKAIVVSEKTIIRKFKETIKAEGLVVGEKIVVIGEPNSDGVIDAKFIRVMPEDFGMMNFPVPGFPPRS